MIFSTMIFSTIIFSTMISSTIISFEKLCSRLDVAMDYLAKGEPSTLYVFVDTTNRGPYDESATISSRLEEDACNGFLKMKRFNRWYFHDAEKYRDAVALHRVPSLIPAIKGPAIRASRNNSRSTLEIRRRPSGGREKERSKKKGRIRKISHE